MLSLSVRKLVMYSFNHILCLLLQELFGVNLAGLNYLREQLARSGQDVFGEVTELARKRHKRN